MRKRIIRVVVLSLVSVLILAVLNINFLLRRNKDYLIDWMEQALGHKITVEQIDVTFWPLGARLVNFAMVNDPAFSAGEVLHAKDVRIELRILPLLVGRFRPSGMVIESPLISILRDGQGRYNFASHADVEKKPRSSADRAPKASSEKQDEQIFLVTSLNVSDGTLRYRDLEKGGELTVTQIDLKVDGFKWDETFDIELQAAVMTAKPNLKFKSQIGPMAGVRDYRDVPLDGDLQVDNLDMGKINSALPQFRRALPKVLRFDGIYTTQGLKFRGTLNNLSLKGAITGTDASVRFE